MNGLDELSSFLYNILPGTLFVILVDGLELLPDHYLKSDDNNYIFFVILIGIFVGYIFHSLSKIILDKLCKYNDRALDQINTQNSFNNIALQILNKWGFGRSKKKGVLIQNDFHIMNSYLQSGYTPFLISDFSKRRALWGNLYIGVVLLLVLMLSMSSEYWLTHSFNNLFFLSLFALLCHHAYTYFQKAYYETILNTFITLSNGNMKKSISSMTK
jgi:hypothetical protein